MFFTIKIPTLQTILKKGLPVALAPRGSSWSALPLGNARGEIGVYVIHHDEVIKYVGKTNGKKMSFGMRLLRHFQEAAAGEHTYPRLAEINTPPDIKVSLFGLSKIIEFISFSKETNSIEKEIKAPWLGEIIPLFESALIVALKPEFLIQDQGE